MTQPDSIARYSIASILLHWLMLLLIVGVYAAIEFREFFPKGSMPREALKSCHYMLGLSVLALVWLRIAARLIWPLRPTCGFMSLMSHLRPRPGRG